MHQTKVSSLVIQHSQDLEKRLKMNSCQSYFAILLLKLWWAAIFLVLLFRFVLVFFLVLILLFYVLLIFLLLQLLLLPKWPKESKGRRIGGRGFSGLCVRGVQVEEL